MTTFLGNLRVVGLMLELYYTRYNSCQVHHASAPLGQRLMFYANVTWFVSWMQQQRAADGKWVRCMFVANVAAGNALVTKKKHFSETWTPPPEFQSVVGEVRSWTPVVAFRRWCGK